MSDRRYQVLDEIGRGTSGVVYRAADRLTGGQVALKRLDVRALGGEASPQARLRLVRELRLFASLHHPNLVDVLDYGFDEARRPFFTMELLDAPEALTQAGRGRPVEEQLGLLVQALRALSYLHRRGVIHRGLKPSNVLVVGEVVKLSDVGIAAFDADPYRAPELADNASNGEAGPAADLYAVGVMTYELLSNSLPTGEEPDISTREFDARLIPALAKLLTKEAEHRYDDAGEVIRDLNRALGRPVLEESAAVRDSFLQANRLVGREREIERLTAQLETAVGGRGGALVIQGESGVGKSRLLEELRLVGIAEGVLVLRGHAVAQGGGAYHPWLPILRSLCLVLDVDDAAAAVLKTRVADVGELLGRRVEEAPEVDPQAAQLRFLEAVKHLFRQLGRPALVILENLHWAGSESLRLFVELGALAAELPLLLLGAYSDDERPDLEMELADVAALKLERLSDDAVAELAEAMLGPLGRRGELVDLLRRQTGGNAFFLVEVVRALAEEAGGLDRIDPARLPRQVSTGGIERVLRLRLAQVPRRALSVLRLAAVIGRDVDLRLLEALEPDLRPELWLRICSDAAVLELDDGHWRFANDRLRQALVDELAPGELRAAHRRVAEALRTVYGDDPERVATLAHHSTQAVDPSDPESGAPAVDSLERAGHAAMESCATQEAAELLERALELHAALAPTPARQTQEIRLQIDLGATWVMREGFTSPKVGRAFGRARNLSQLRKNKPRLMSALLGLWRFHVVRSALDTAEELAREMLEHAESRRLASHRLLAEYAVGSTLLFLGRPAAAVGHLERSFELHDSLVGESRQQVTAAGLYLGQNPGVSALAYAGWAHWLLGRADRARELGRRSLELADELAHPFSRAFARTLGAWLEQLTGDVEATEASAREAVELSGQLDYPYFLAVSTLHLSWAEAHRGGAEAAASVERMRQVLAGLRSAGSDLFRPYFLALVAEACGLAGRPVEGLEALGEALENVERLGGAWWEGEIHRLRGELYLRLPQPNRDQAESCFEQALEAARRRREESLERRAEASLARLEGGFHPP